MLHLFHLGPLTLLGRPSYVLAGVDEQGAFSEQLVQLAAALETVAMLGSEERPSEMDANVAIRAGGYDMVAVSRAPDSMAEGVGSSSPTGQAAA